MLYNTFRCVAFIGVKRAHRVRLISIESSEKAVTTLYDTKRSALFSGTINYDEIGID